MTNPHLRQRVQVVQVKPSVRKDVTNAELLENFRRSVKLAPNVLANYTGAVKDAFRYFTTPEGREVPVREWTKEGVWNYIHYCEANYCASFRAAPYRPEQAMCRKVVWVGMKNADAAAQENCATCPLFRAAYPKHRVKGIARFFRYLARVGVVPVNFMVDVVREFSEDNPETDHTERRRNPTVEEEVALVNGTHHPQRRFFYAVSAKWGLRPREMFLLDRFASFGIPLPEGTPMPPGFENGFTKHPYVAGHHKGGDMVYLPEKRGAQGEALKDKRKGNRWLVDDPELRPLAEQHFAWWERTVKRDVNGQPVTTKLWLNSAGMPLEYERIYPEFFVSDAERLGILKPGERYDPRRTWTAHCQRHFLEKLLEMHKVPDNWCNHFRGDALRDARKNYFKPKPEEVHKMYLELVPTLGFKPLPETRATRAPRSEAETHRAILQRELERTRALNKKYLSLAAARITSMTGEVLIVPQRAAPSFLFALRKANPGVEYEVTREAADARGRGYAHRDRLAGLLEEAIARLA